MVELKPQECAGDKKKEIPTFQVQHYKDKGEQPGREKKQEKNPLFKEFLRCSIKELSL